MAYKKTMFKCPLIQDSRLLCALFYIIYFFNSNDGCISILQLTRQCGDCHHGYCGVHAYTVVVQVVITCYRSGDFLPISVHGFGNKRDAANGPPAIVETLCEEEDSLLILSKCRIKLYIEWIQRTSDDDKSDFLWGINSTWMRLLWRDTYEKLSATWSAAPSTAIMVSMVLKPLETI